MKNSDQLKIFLNILARTGLSGNAIGEFAKTVAGVNQFNAQQEVGQMMMPQSPQGTMSSQATQSMPQDLSAVNQPQNEGQGALNLPPQM